MVVLCKTSFVEHVKNYFVQSLLQESQIKSSQNAVATKVNSESSGEAFVDGSCYKHGPSVWNQTGWSVVVVNSEGDCTAHLSGQTGQDLLPTSGAAGHVALAVSHLCPNITHVHSDHLGAINKYSQPGFDRKNLYSGLELDHV